MIVSYVSAAAMALRLSLKALGATRIRRDFFEVDIAHLQGAAGLNDQRTKGRSRNRGSAVSVENKAKQEEPSLHSTRRMRKLGQASDSIH